MLRVRCTFVDRSRGSEARQERGEFLTTTKIRWPRLAHYRQTGGGPLRNPEPLGWQEARENPNVAQILYQLWNELPVFSGVTVLRVTLAPPVPVLPVVDARPRAIMSS